MIIALGVCFALVLICCFLRIDVTRAVKAKEEWRSQAIKTDIDRQGLSTRVDRLLETLRANNQCYQELSDALEDAELELTETKSELENSEAQLAFDTSVRAEQEKTISFWIRQFNQAVDERRAVQRERDEFDARGAALAQERNALAAAERELVARCRNIASALGVSEEDSREAGFLWGKVLELKRQRDALEERATKAESSCDAWNSDYCRVRDELTKALHGLDKTEAECNGLKEIGAELMIERDDLRDRLVKGGAEREEERMLLNKEAAMFRHSLGEVIGCGLGAALSEGELIERVRTLRAESVKSAADLVDVTRERDALRARPDYTYEITAIAEALRQGRGFTNSVRGVRDYVAPKFVGPLSPDVDLIVCALDDLKSDLVSRMDRLRVVESERDEVRTKLRDERALTAAVVEGIRTRVRDNAFKVRHFVRNFVGSKGLVLSSIRTPDMDSIVQELDDRVIKPTRGPAEDLAPPAHLPRKNKSKRQAVH